MPSHFLKAVAIFTIGLTFSCRKYEEGPRFSIRSAEYRLTNSPWDVKPQWYWNTWQHSFTTVHLTCSGGNPITCEDSRERTEGKKYDFRRGGDFYYSRKARVQTLDTNSTIANCDCTYGNDDIKITIDTYKWEFQNSKKLLELKNSSFNNQRFEILRLTNKEMRLIDVFNSFNDTMDFTR